MPILEKKSQTNGAPPTDQEGPKSPHVSLSIQREAFSQEQVDEELHRVSEKRAPLRDRLRYTCTRSKCTCTKDCLCDAVGSGFPLLQSLRSYSPRKQLAGDILAGISVAVVHIPQGLGFAILTGVPPVYGLYASFWPALVYTLLGTGAHVSVGTMALTSLMINSVVQRQVLNFQPPETLPGISQDNVTYQDTNVTYIGVVDTAPEIKHILNSTMNVPPLVTMNMTLTTTDTAEHSVPGLSALDTYKVDIVCSITLMVGIFQIVLGILRLGILSAFMSKPFVGGFTTGAGFHIATSQIKFLMGVTIPPLSGMFLLPKTWFFLCKNIPQMKPVTFTSGIVCFIVLILIKTQINTRFKKRLVAPVPAELFVVILGCLVSYFAKFSETYDVHIINKVPLGMPAPLTPSMNDAQTYIIDAFIIALVSFTITFSMGSLLGSKHGYSVVANKEMLVLGVAHTLTAFFSGFAGAAAPPRCLVLDATGATTQLAGLVSSLLLLLVILLVGPLFEPLPITVLAAIIIVAVLPLFLQFKSLPQLWRVNKNDFAVWVVTFLVVVIFDVGLGLGVGLIVNIGVLVVRGFFTKGHLLGSNKEGDLFVPVKAYQNTEEEDVIKIFRFEGDLNFLTKERFKSGINKLFDNPTTSEHVHGVKENQEMRDTANLDTLTENTEKNQEECEVLYKDDLIKDQDRIIKPPAESHDACARSNKEESRLMTGTKPCVLILDMSCVTYIDVMGVGALKSAQNDLDDHGIHMVLACISHSVLTTLKHAGGTWINGDKMEVYPTLQDAYAIVRAGLSQQ